MQEFTNAPQSENRADINQTLPESNQQLVKAFPPIKLENNLRFKQEFNDIKPSVNQADIIALQKFPIKEPTPLNLEYFACPLTMADEFNPCPKYDSEWKVRQHIELFHKITVGCQKKLQGIQIHKQIL